MSGSLAAKSLTQGPLVSFGHHGFGALWLSSVLYAIAMSMERVAVGWLVLDETGSAFLTALSFAVQLSPNLVFGPIAGALADRSNRAHIFRIAAAARALTLLFAFAVAVIDSGAIAAFLALVAFGGISLALHTASLGAVIPDIVGQSNALNATSITNLGKRGVGIVGGLSAGFVIGWIDPAAAFLIASVIGVAAVGAGFAVPSSPTVPTGRSVWAETRAGLEMFVKVPIVTTLLSLMIVVEILGFSYLSILPVLADQALDVGPEGLGALTAAAAAGALVGMTGLALLGDYRHKGRLLLAEIFCFGLLLLALGSTDVFVLSLLVVAGIGAATAMVDTLEWVLLQAGVPRELRGRALGGWSAAIGMGWVGPIIVGLMSEAWGVQQTLIITGSALAFTGLISAALLRRLRHAG